jgi:hypothetical protein
VQLNEDEKRAPLWPFLVLCAVLAAWIDLGDFHREENSDAIVPVLTSLYHWSAFYWETNRIGMLLPLLAMPFRNPLTNLLVQAWVVLFSTFALFYLLPRYLVRGPGWAHAGSLTLLAFLLLLPRGTRFTLTFGMPHYPVSMALAVAALLLVEGTGPGRLRRLALAAVLMVLGNWVNSSLPGILGPLVLLRPWLIGPRPRWSRPIDAELVSSVGLVLLGALFTFGIRQVFPNGVDPMLAGFAPVRKWPGAWRELLAAVCECSTDTYWGCKVVPTRERAETIPPAVRLVLALAYAGSATVGLGLCVRKRQLALPCAALAVLAAGAVFGLSIGTTTWVSMNECHPKYWFPSLLAALTAVGSLTAGVFAFRGQSVRVGALAVLPVVLLPVVVLHYGKPSRAGVRRDILGWNKGADPVQPISPRAADLLASRCTHLCGDYWDVWMTVFQTNLLLHEQREDRVVWGTAYRAIESWDKWGGWPPEAVRVGVCVEDGELHSYGDFSLRAFFPETALVEQTPTVWVYRPKAVLPNPQVKGPVVLAAWHGGFYWGLTSDRLCRGKGLLTLTNTSDRPVKVSMSVCAMAELPGSANLWIEGVPFSRRVTIGAVPIPIEATFVLHPGSQTLTWSSDGPAKPGTPGASVQLLTVFRVFDLRLTEHPMEENPPSVPGSS